MPLIFSAGYLLLEHRSWARAALHNFLAALYMTSLIINKSLQSSCGGTLLGCFWSI